MFGAEKALTLLVFTVILSSCADEPPPPPPPGPEAANYRDQIDKIEGTYDSYGEIDDISIPEESIMPLESEPEIAVESIEEEYLPPPPVSEELVGGLNEEMRQEDLTETPPMNIGPDGKEAAVRFAEEMASYPGGESALFNEIRSYIVYPKAEYEQHITGKVYLGFVVEKDGSISEVQVERGVTGGPGLSKEAIRVVNKLSKKFNPAKMNGRPVRFKMTIPINLALQ